MHNTKCDEHKTKCNVCAIVHNSPVVGNRCSLILSHEETLKCVFDNIKY